MGHGRRRPHRRAIEGGRSAEAEHLVLDDASEKVWVAEADGLPFNEARKVLRRHGLHVATPWVELVRCHDVEPPCGCGGTPVVTEPDPARCPDAPVETTTAPATAPESAAARAGPVWPPRADYRSFHKHSGEDAAGVRGAPGGISHGSGQQPAAGPHPAARVFASPGDSGAAARAGENPHDPWFSGRPAFSVPARHRGGGEAVEGAGHGSRGWSGERVAPRPT